MKIMYFDSFDEFDACENKQDEEMVAVVKRNNGLCADLLTETKSWKVAVNRFFRALEKAGFNELANWKESVKESCENGYFSDKESYWDTEKGFVYTGGYFWEVEEYDGMWYIALKA